MEKNEQPKLQTDTVYLSSLDACTVMEMRLKINVGEHSSWTRRLQLTILSLAVAKDAQARVEKEGKYRVRISLDVLPAFNNCSRGSLSQMELPQI